jgi:Tfp pilus assembly protein PilX
MQKQSKQQGAVLVFSLVMLLLMTLVGVNMIQQNRLQFMMATNTQDQNTRFAISEDILEIAENYIGKQRYKTWPLPKPIPNPVGNTFECEKTNSKFVQLTPRNLTADLDLANTSSVVKAEITQTACLSVAGVESVCMPDPNNPSQWDSNEAQCNQSDQAQCATEIYSVRITISNPDTGAERIIESRYAVRCDK